MNKFREAAAKFASLCVASHSVTRGRHGDVEAEAVDVDVENVAFADAVGHGELEADRRPLTMRGSVGSWGGRRKFGRMRLKFHGSSSMCMDASVPGCDARSAPPDSRAHGALGPVRATPRMPPPPGLPPTLEELFSGPNTATRIVAQNCRILSRRANRARQHIQRPRLAFLLRESLAAAAAEPHQILVAETEAPVAHTHDDTTTLDAALARLARLDVGFAALLFERVPRHALPRLAIVGSGAPIRDADAAAALARMRAILDVGAPLTLLWDLTKFSLPSRKQAKLGVEWAGANAQDLDRGLQGIAIVVGSPVIRSVAAFFVRVLKPPQPMCVCASVEEATAFAEERCQSVRDWSAKAG